MKPRSRKWGITGSLLAAIVLAAMLAGPAFAGPPGGGCTSPYASNDYHEWVVIEESFATCTEPGLKVWLCENCKEYYYEDVPALGHAWDGGTVTQAATCTADGVLTYTCYNCGAAYTEAIPATGHAWDGGTVTQAATCTADGVLTYTCYNCGAAYTEAVPATGHSPAHVAGYAATCTEAGLTDGSVCSVCGEVLTAQTAIPATGHNWDGGTVTQAATCTADGVRTYTCYNCGAAYTEAIPATGHSPVSVAGYAATCTEAGLTDGSVCSVCGEVLTAQTAIPATGHDWDEGVVIREPDGDTPGIMLYTCRNNPAHTWTEEIEPTTTSATTTTTTSSIFNLMRKIPPEAADAGGMVVTLQPEGGRITLDGEDSHTMTIAVEGGVEPYTYEWHYITKKLVVPDGMMQMAADRFEGAAKSYHGKGELFYSAFQNALQALGQTGWKKNLPEQGQKDKLNIKTKGLNDFILGDSNSPTYTATIGNCDYYCIIRDSAGHEAYTDDAYVGYHLYIAQQPENASIYGKDSVTLTCTAGGGNPENYIYTISSVDGTESPALDEPAAEIKEPGKYYFTVSDGTEKKDSEIVTVYDAAELWVIRGIEKWVYIWGDETAVITMNFGGGIPPYTYEWTLGSETLSSGTTSETSLSWTADTKVYGYGTYRLTVKDAAGNVADDFVCVDYRQLRIAIQPEGGMLPYEGARGVFIRMDEGNAPFSYRLYLQGGKEIKKEKTENDFCYFFIDTAGTYHIVIEDADNHSATSDDFVVRENEFRITEYTDLAWATEEKKAALNVKVEGGLAPYIYSWEYESLDYGDGTYENKWETVRDTIQDTVYVKAPGFYSCTVEDANGSKDYVTGIIVHYDGQTPVIIRQPQNTVLNPDRKASYQASLSCHAVSGDGTTNRLKYWWQAYAGDGIWTTVSSGRTLTLNDSLIGSYRCVVTDPMTKKSTTSNIAAITKGELNVTVYGLQTDNWGISSDIVFGVDGGLPPYTVQLYKILPVYQPYNQPMQYYDFLYGLFTFDQPGDDRIRYESETIAFVEVDPDGTVVPQSVNIVYYIVAKDSAGNEYRTGDIKGSDLDMLPRPWEED